MSPATLLAAAHSSVTTAQDVSIGHILLQMALALGLIVGGIWGLGKIMGRGRGKRRTGARNRGRADGLTILSRQMIGKGKSIAVVQAGEQCFLVGIGEAGLTPLGELTTTSGASGPEGGVVPDVVAPAPAPAMPTPMTLASLAPLDLAGLDLSALARSAPTATAATTGNGAVVTGAPAPTAGGAPSMRAWLDNLREATVRR